MQLAYEGMVVARGVEPRPRASEAREISFSPGDGWYGGATRERRTPSRCLQGSNAPERCWRENGDQPWDRTTFSRTSAERYDHTSSLVDVEPTAGVEPAPAPYEGAVLPITLRRRWSRLEDSNPRSSGNRPDVLPLDEASSLVPAVGVEPTSSRLKGGHAAAASRWQ